MKRKKNIGVYPRFATFSLDMFNQVNITFEHDVAGLYALWIVAFQSTKRKEKQGNPANGLTLLQKERDTKTSSSISSEVNLIRTLKTTGKTKSDRAL